GAFALLHLTLYILPDLSDIIKVAGLHTNPKYDKNQDTHAGHCQRRHKALVGIYKIENTGAYNTKQAKDDDQIGAADIDSTRLGREHDPRARGAVPLHIDVGNRQRF